LAWGLHDLGGFSVIIVRLSEKSREKRSALLGPQARLQASA
jgi:hypothetical protein